MYDIFYTEQM
ncbi:hypothetical protein DMN91_011458, partial [Ooceraea biroi]